MKNIGRLHFVGIGGIGMSGLASILLSRGSDVSGSDTRPNAITERLKGMGARIYVSHSGDNVGADTDLVVTTNSIGKDNPEIAKARDIGIPVVRRGELLRLLIEDTPRSIAVTGTHGKTTTSALAAHILEMAGMAPISLIGGEVGTLGGNARDGSGKVIVTELDESDGLFSDVSCTTGVITNIEREHMEHYGSMGALERAFRDFVSKIPPRGVLVYPAGDPVVASAAGALRGRGVGFGLSGDPYAGARVISYRERIEIDMYYGGRLAGRLRCPLLGIHNVMNLLAASAASLEEGVMFDALSRAAASFPGVGRRFEMKGHIGGIKVIEDYAHHPTEIAAVIRAARDFNRGRIIAVFQPHRYSRTSDLAGDLVDCFREADAVILTDIYSADEDASTAAVSARDIFLRMDSKGHELLEFVEKSDIPALVADTVREGDIVLILGAGDICDVSSPVVSEIERKTRRAPATGASGRVV